MKNFIRLLLTAIIIIMAAWAIMSIWDRADEIDQWPDKVKLDTTTTVTR